MDIAAIPFGYAIPAIILTLVLLGITFWLIGKTSKKTTLSETLIVAPDKIVAPVVSPVIAPVVPAKTFAQRLRDGLSRSRTEVWQKLEMIFVGRTLDQDLLNQVEELLFSTDLGPEMVGHLIAHLQNELKGQTVELAQIKTVLYEFLKNQMSPVQAKLSRGVFSLEKLEGTKPQVIMVVGVNGAGKTTTIGKLATKFTKQGASVVVGACDTFRAAAVDQLQIWCDRAGATMIRAKEGADPSGVGYEALQKAISTKADFCILDTAGRLHTKENLMEELKKSKKVLAKLDATKPDQVLLVIDAITGQNALRQAEEFHRALGLTGLVFTKCDGSARAGNAVSILNKLSVPLAYIGVGETVEDLDVFDLDLYLHALLDMPSH